MAGVVDLFLVYQFIKRLVTPFDKTPAFALGLIDKKGNKLRSPKTQSEKDAYGYFDRIVFNLKRLLGKIPGGQTQLANYAAAILLLREHRGDNILENRLLENVLKEHMDMLHDISIQSITEALKEDGGIANAAGGGHVAGIGVGPKGEPGVPPMAMLRRRKPAYFAGTRVFEVDNGTFYKNRTIKKPHVKYEKYIEEEQYGDEVREYANQNPGSGIIIRNESTGEMRFLRYGNKQQSQFPKTHERTTFYKMLGKRVASGKSSSSRGGNGD